MTSLFAVSALALATGTGSALLPVVNAEAYAGVAATRLPATATMAVVLALAVGQTAGKLVLFESARRGAARASRRRVHRRRRVWSGVRRGARWTTRRRAWSARAVALLGSSRTGPPVVLTAAALGVPPLAAVSLAAGACGQRRWLFAVLCLVGRTARFGAVAGLAWVA